MIVGDDVERARLRAQVAAAAAAPEPAKADRAMYYATGGAGPAGAARSNDDLVGGVARAARCSVDKVAPAALPSELRGLSPKALQDEIARRARLRQAAQAELAQLARQRTEYLQAHARGGEGGFDAKVKDALDAQLR